MKIPLNMVLYAAIGFFSLIGMAVYGLKKNGRLTFGEPVERRHCGKEKCDDHPVVVSGIADLKEEQKAIRDALAKTNEHLGKISTDVSFVAGFVRGRNGKQLTIGEKE